MSARGARLAATGALAVALFYAFAWLVRAGGEQLGAGKLAIHAALKLGLIALALLLGGRSRAGRQALGLQAGCKLGKAARRWYLLAAVGMGGAVLVMVLGGARHPLTEGLSFVQLVLSVWLLSSVAEEVFVRGLVQGWLRQAAGEGAGASRAVVGVSAAVFSALHASLLWSGAGALGGGAILGATFVVGWSAAELRERSGGLLQPILVHVFGNVSAVPFGALGVLVYWGVHGALPAIAQ